MDRFRIVLAFGLLGPGMLFGGQALAQSTSTTDPADAERKAPAQAPEAAPDESRVDAIRQYAVARREQALTAARAATTAIDAQVDALQAQIDAQWAHMSAHARTASTTAMSDLRRRRSDAAEWYGGMRHGSADAWVEVRGGFVTSYHDLAAALRRARTQFRDSTAPAKTPAPEPAPAKNAPPAGGR